MDGPPSAPGAGAAARPRPGPDRSAPEDPPLPARDAYRRWAPRYDEETAVSALEDRLVRELTPPVAGRSLLDAGCGTGRRLPARAAGWRRAVGVDLVPEMLRAGRGGEAAGSRSGTGLVAGELRALPFRSGLFDLLWCRLVLGHVGRLGGVYGELARVSGPGAILVISDFHPDAVAAGHTRTFRDARGRLRSVEHHVHGPGEHRQAAEAAGWTWARTLEAPAGPEERAFYERAGRTEQFERERDLPLVLVMAFGRGEDGIDEDGKAEGRSDEGRSDEGRSDEGGRDEARGARGRGP